MRRVPSLLLLALALGSWSGAGEPSDLRVMSFNIRYGTARDGPNAWPKRRAAVVAAIEAFRPHVLGTQECLAFQRDELLSELSGYAALGVGREDGRERGEMTAIFYDKARFELVADGHLWLSEMPERPGSIGWDAALPRVASWVLLEDLVDEGRKIFAFNAHFDHRGARARLESARLLRAQVERLDRSTPVVLLGDFNAPGDGEVQRALLRGSRPLVDVYRALHPDARDAEGTLSGFGEPPPSWRGLRIDWILASEDLEPLEASVDRARYLGRYPSDHFPLRAVLRYRDTPEETP